MLLDEYYQSTLHAPPVPPAEGRVRLDEPTTVFEWPGAQAHSIGSIRAGSVHAVTGRVGGFVRVDLGDQVVMRVRAPEPAFWRGQTFSEFDDAVTAALDVGKPPVERDPASQRFIGVYDSIWGRIAVVAWKGGLAVMDLDSRAVELEAHLPVPVQAQKAVGRVALQPPPAGARALPLPRLALAGVQLAPGRLVAATDAFTPEFCETTLRAVIKKKSLIDMNMEAFRRGYDFVKKG